MLAATENYTVLATCWWTLVELAATTEIVVPHKLVALVHRMHAGTLPGEGLVLAAETR